MCYIYNVGTGCGTRTKGLYDAISKSTGNDPGFKVLPPRKGEIRAISLDISRTKKNLNWTPGMTMEEGLKDTIKYFKKL